jgi:uncharacterized RDD family membrane protein YckC
VDAPPQVPPPYPPPPPAGYPPYGYGYYGAMPVRPGPAPGLVYAGFWIRFVAYLFDAAILDIPLYGLLFALFGSQLIRGSCGNYSQIYGFGYFCTGSFTGWFFLGVLVVQLVHAIYFILMWSVTGSTVGQKLFRLRVVDARDGGRISLGKAAIRFLGYIVSGLVFNLGYMWAGWDPQKQGWHDKMASTFVVQRA